MMASTRMHYLSLVFSIFLQVAIVATGSALATGGGSGLVCIEQYTSSVHQNLCKHCRNFSFTSLPEQLQAGSNVNFCTSHIQLDTKIHFQELHSITFTGIKQKTVINCSKSHEAGVSFTKSEDIHLENLTFENCGTLQESTSINITSKGTLQFYTSLYVFNVTDFSMHNVIVRNSNGLGLAMFDVGGLVTISHCVFDNNKIYNVSDYGDVPGGGGMYVEFTYCPPGKYGKNCDNRYDYTVNSTYKISHSNFTNNNASNPLQINEFNINNHEKFQGFGRGGGLQVTFRGKSFGNTIAIYNCNFSNNEAFWGGGLKASFQDESQYNTLNILESTFRQNKCFTNGGGGANVGYTFYHEPFPFHNKILFSDSNFLENEAKYGGGLAFYSSDSFSSELNNTVEFYSCTWTANKARYGSAVSLSIQAWTTVLRGNLPTPVFSDAKFTNNIIVDWHIFYKEGVFEIYTSGTGAFFATRFTIYFYESIEFKNNNGSGMYLTSSVIKIAPNTSVTFVGNSGFNGGAIALVAFSVIVLGNSTLLTFKNNTAIRCGGAIYSFSIDKHDYLSSRSCFLQNENPIIGSPFNVSVSFLNNTVGTYKIGSNYTMSYRCGHSVFATSLKPCLYFCKQRGASYNAVSIKHVLNCIGNVTFGNGSRMREYEMSTSSAKFVYNPNKTNFSMIPGKKDYLPIHMVDDLNQTVQSKYHLMIFNDKNSQIKADKAYTILTGSRTELYGRPGDSAMILLSKIGARRIAIRFRIQIEHCPPGYIITVDGQFSLNLTHCRCSTGTNQSYPGVYSCNDEKFTAKILHGFWIGYVGIATEENLHCGYCPDRYCFRKQEKNRVHFLPDHASIVELDMLVCGISRTGVLCGKCRDGYSVFYHSSSLICYKSSNCSIGWILYLVSELVPLTLIFIVIVICNISFVSGKLNGFIFFAQVFDLFSITGNGFIWFPAIAFRALITIRAIYRFLNLDFFSANELAFCLWKGATSLDMIVFKFVTVAYALLLVLITIWLMNKCNIYQRLSCLRVSTVKHSIIHGLSAFLVMVYTQCAKISFKLLDFTKIYAKGYVHQYTVVTYQGNLTYFGREHFPYTIPAIFSLLIVVVSPVIILTLYPSCFKIISFLKLDEFRCVSWLLERVPHALLKPFADSFQSCFKDNMRFFAGLYFAYRVIILIGWFAPSHFTQAYILLELIIVTILIIHSITQPYNSRKHNVLDSLLFFNLALINGITLYNYYYTKLYDRHKYEINVLIHLQLALAYAPLICFIVYIIFSLTKKVKDYYRLKMTSWNIQLKEMMNSVPEDELPSRLEEDCEEIEESTGDINYELLKE